MSIVSQIETLFFFLIILFNVIVIVIIILITLICIIIQIRTFDYRMNNIINKSTVLIKKNSDRK